MDKMQQSPNMPQGPKESAQVSHAGAEPLLLDAAKASHLCGVSRSAWWSLNSAGRVPRCIHLGRRALWSRRELVAWIDAGCPPREKWEAIRRAKP